ncbi:MAG: hypothetical protein IPH61_16895 [Bacteroidetes bacterium]|nr:hypothetical protein [Bacteroidota bacterium]MBP8755130.1 hypothetical protein [Chitinophagales bacterium]MBK8488046.1 hypothetical protein [Bacteroidota bacterium]MBK8682198.1 hypothetical protein [Bacteroidota bacterium]MBP9188428.1 hypothetical protein [Chitinophagales bacterium]
MFYATLIIEKVKIEVGFHETYINTILKVHAQNNKCFRVSLTIVMVQFLEIAFGVLTD